MQFKDSGHVASTVNKTEMSSLFSELKIKVQEIIKG